MKTERETINSGVVEIAVKGKPVAVPSAVVCGRTVITSGARLRIAAIQDEVLIEDEPVADPEVFLHGLRETGLAADIFTFGQKLPDTTPRYRYCTEWDNLAVIPISTFAEWWENRVESSVRRAVRKATKSGITVRVAEFDDALVEGIVNINNETPVRQGRLFWHYQKDFDSVRRENNTYADRNTFLGAYLDGELVGFIRLTYAGNTGNIIQLLSMVKHYDKRPANALIAKAVEVCAEKGIQYLAYCNYVYNDPKSSLTEFKRRNGFEKILVPRYYVPLTLRGHIALRLGLHRGLSHYIPRGLFSQLLKIRGKWYARRFKSIGEIA